MYSGKPTLVSIRATGPSRIAVIIIKRKDPPQIAAKISNLNKLDVDIKYFKT